MPKAQPAKTYPAHDAHPTDAVTVALDPYDMADKADIFSVHYNEEGLLPIFLVITNEGEQPIALAGMKAQLVTVNRTKMSPATVDDIYRRLSRPSTSRRKSRVPSSAHGPWSLIPPRRDFYFSMSLEFPLLLREHIST